MSKTEEKTKTSSGSVSIKRKPSNGTSSGVKQNKTVSSGSPKKTSTNGTASGTKKDKAPSKGAPAKSSTKAPQGGQAEVSYLFEIRATSIPKSSESFLMCFFSLLQKIEERCTKSGAKTTRGSNHESSCCSRRYRCSSDGMFVLIDMLGVLHEYVGPVSSPPFCSLFTPNRTVCQQQQQHLPRMS